MNRIFGKVSIQEKINFVRHLAIVTKSGLPLLESLKIIEEQTESKTLQKIIRQLAVDVNNGHLLSDGLVKHQKTFGDFFISIIRIGELSGTLTTNLVYLAEELKKAKALQNKVHSAMVYPAVILVAMVAVSVFLTFFIFPKLLPVISGLNVQLPLPTKILIGFLDISKKYGIWIVLGIIALISGLKFITSKVRRVKYFFDRSVFYVPVIATFVESVNVANFARILALLLKSGITIVDAIGITRDTFENSAYKLSFSGAQDFVRKGGQLSDFLATRKDFFPKLLTGIIKIGESTGNLEDNLFYLSDYYTEELDNRLHNMTTFLEPLLLLIMGLMVGFLAMAIILPIYSISKGVR